MMTNQPHLRAFVERLTEMKSPDARRAAMRQACEGPDGIWNVPPAGYAQPALVEIHLHGILGAGPTLDEAIDSWLRAARNWLTIAEEPGIRGARQDCAFLVAQLPALAILHGVMLEHLLADLIQTLAEGMHNCAPAETRALLDIIKLRLDGDDDDEHLMKALEVIQRKTFAYHETHARGAA